MDNHPASAAYPAEKENGSAGSGYPEMERGNRPEFYTPGSVSKVNDRYLLPNSKYVQAKRYQRATEPDTGGTIRKIRPIRKNHSAN